jgi:hypothetical protein
MAGRVKKYFWRGEITDYSKDTSARRLAETCAQLFAGSYYLRARSA